MNKWLAVAAAAVLLCGGGARPAAAQSREDSAAVWLDAAHELRQSGQPGAADALLELLRRRFAGTAASAAADRLLARARAQPEPERPGRVELLVFSTTYGAWLGIALPIIANADEPEIFGLGMLVGAPAGFLVAREYLKTHPLTEGQARAITFGGTWGSWQGLGWTQVLDLGEPDPYCYENYCDDPSPTGEALVAGSVLGGIVGIATGAVMARKPISSGVATSVSFGGLWGTWYGGALGVLFGLENDNLFASTLVGGDAGLVAMAILAPRWNPSRARARLVSLGGLVGLLAGGGLDLIIQPDDEKVAVMIPAVASAAGLLIAAASMRPAAGLERGDRAPGSSSLLDFRDGHLEVGTPAVSLLLDRERGHKARTALYVPVLQARF